MKRYLVLLAALSLIPAIASAADYFTGDDLMNELRRYERVERGDDSYEEAIGWAHYMGYVAGVLDAIPPGQLCAESVSGNQAFAIVAKYLHEHPERWGAAAVTLVVEALLEAFPCAAGVKP